MSGRVSVLMPVRDGERFVGQALDSIAAQTRPAHETIVVDGGSQDRSAEIARGYPRTRVIPQTGTGFWGAWNDGLDAAEGELIAFLDSDDLWEPRKLELQVDLLRRRPEVDYVIARGTLFLEPGQAPLPEFPAGLFEGDHVAHMPGALLARREVFDTVGRFSTDQFTIGSDIEWFARAKDSPAVMAIVDEVLIRKRIHDANVSHVAARDLNRQITSLLRASVARKRRAAS